MVFWSSAEGPGRVCCVQEMSMAISIRRGKGRSLNAYSTAHWLKSINNKTTQWGARLLVHRKIHRKSICVWGKYLFCTPCCVAIKDLLCLFMPACVSLCTQESKPLTSERRREYSETDLPSCPPHHSPPPLSSIPHSLFTIFPISHCSVVAVSLCAGEACMCILTRAAPRFPPSANTERLLPRALDSYK